MLKETVDTLKFVHRPDLHRLPAAAAANEHRLHGGFAVDMRPGYGHIYYGMPGSGILRICRDLERQELIKIPSYLQDINFHSTKLGLINGQQCLILPADGGEMVVVMSLEGRIEFILPRPTFDQYAEAEVPFRPTDVVLRDETLYVADGYGANFINVADVTSRRWVRLFGGKAEAATDNGLFSTAHGINLHHSHNHLVIADRPSARIQHHDFHGRYERTGRLPAGAWPCGINYIEWRGRQLAVIGTLYDPVQDRPAPIYIVDAHSYEVLDTIRPKEELGIAPAQHLHNVVFHIYNEQLFLICQAWNPGHFFVLELAA